MKGLLFGIVLMFAGIVWASDKSPDFGQYGNPAIQNPIFCYDSSQNPIPCGPPPMSIVTLPDQPSAKSRRNAKKPAPKALKTPEPPATSQHAEIERIGSICEGEACPGSGNANPTFLGQSEAANIPEPTNNMQFTFPDGTKACAVFTNGEAGSEQLGSGDLFVDNAENWIVLQHDSSATEMGNCDPSKNFCVYAPNCSSKLGHVTIQQATTKDGSVVNYTGNYYLNDGICAVDGVCGSSGGLGGCYPSSHGAPTYVCSSVIEDGADTVSETAWEDTLAAPSINPYAAGVGEFNNASRGVPNLPLGTAN